MVLNTIYGINTITIPSFVTLYVIIIIIYYLLLEVVKITKLPEGYTVFRGDFNHPHIFMDFDLFINFRLSVLHVVEAHLDDNKCMTIFVGSKMEVISLFCFLRRQLPRHEEKMAVVHAELTSRERGLVATEFSEGKVDLVVATTAFEMGIDNRRLDLCVIVDVSNEAYTYLS